jgi:hypothetical protein
MRSITGNVRRATQDMDIDFIRYSLSDESIDIFIQKINCLPDITIERMGKITELNQQDYHGKSVKILITDQNGASIESKIDLGVHKRLEIEQEEYCFNIAYGNEGASLLICLESYIFSDDGMRENDMSDIIRRITKVFQNKSYRSKVDGSDKRWLDENIDEIFEKILRFLISIK